MKRKIQILLAGNNSNKLIELADNAINASDFEFAVRCLDKADKLIDSTNNEMKILIALNLSHSFAKINSLQRSLGILKFALKNNPNNLELMHALAFTYLDMKNPHEAIKTSDKTLSIAPKDLTALSNKAIALGQIGNYEDSLEILENVCSIEPDFGENFYNLGKSYEKVGTFQKAIDAYNMALKLEPQNTNSIISKGNCLIKIGEGEKACRVFKLALEMGEIRAEENIREHCMGK